MALYVNAVITLTIAATLLTIPAVHHAADRIGAWLAGIAPFPRADVRLGTFLGVFIAATWTLT